MITTHLIQNLFYSNNKMKGGSPMLVSVNPIEEILSILLALFINGFIVYLLYNYLVPRIVKFKEGEFRELTYMESVLLVILTNTLFGRICL
jgi:hypothetical protein